MSLAHGVPQDVAQGLVQSHTGIDPTQVEVIARQVYHSTANPFERFDPARFSSAARYH